MGRALEIANWVRFVSRVVGETDVFTQPAEIVRRASEGVRPNGLAQEQILFRKEPVSTN